MNLKIADLTKVIVALEAGIAKGNANLATLEQQLADLQAAGFGGGAAATAPHKDAAKQKADEGNA